jgi:beta-D-xylosidase 4
VISAALPSPSPPHTPQCSYNAVNGVPSCASDWLLGDLLRDSWGFDGYVTSDCDADSDVFFSHHYTNTTSEAVAVILRAGTDVDCGGFMGQYAPAALADGSITEADIDTVLKRLWRVRLRLGQFDGPTALDGLGVDQVCNPYALELARDGVRQSVVLAKNDAATLPLDASKFASVVVIGPNMDSTEDNNYYGGEPCNHSHFTYLDAIKQHIPAAVGIKGVPDVGSGDTSGVAAAAAAAAAADLVVLAVGSDLSLEAEGHDRTSIDFSDGQKALIAAVTAAARGPVIALIQSGGAMDTSELLANPKIGAILICGHASVQVVGAGDVVFGKTLDGRPVAPAGRMSQMTCASGSHARGNLSAL